MGNRRDTSGPQGSYPINPTAAVRWRGRPLLWWRGRSGTWWPPGRSTAAPPPALPSPQRCAAGQLPRCAAPRRDPAPIGATPRRAAGWSWGQEGRPPRGPLPGRRAAEVSGSAVVPCAPRARPLPCSRGGCPPSATWPCNGRSARCPAPRWALARVRVDEQTAGEDAAARACEELRCEIEPVVVAPCWQGHPRQ